MADTAEIKKRIEFRKSALSRLRDAYIALIEGGAKSYTIGDRQLTRFDLPSLGKEIEAKEAEIDALENLISGGKPRKAFAVLPRDW